MSIIQTIRDRAWIVVSAIAIALIAFIVQDAFSGNGIASIFGNGRNTLGKVDGTTIEYTEFENRFKQIEDNYTAQGYPMDERMRTQIREQLWNQYVEEAVLTDDYEELGLNISNGERGDILYGSNPPPQLSQQFRDSLGNYDATAAYAAINSIPKNSKRYDDFWNQFVPELEKMRLREKFTTLVSKSAYVPKWLVEKSNTENSQRANISFVQVPYTSINDSTIKVSDEDIQKFVDAHPKMFPQEKARGISYVSFDAGPSAADSAEIRQQLENLKAGFKEATDVEDFLRANGSELTAFYNSYIHRREIKHANIDSIIQTPVGEIYGPYVDNGNYAMARVIDVKNLPDTVKVRHILVATHDRNPQTGQMVPVRMDADARKLVDSLADAIKKGSKFDSLVTQFSDDPGSKDKGGVYDKVHTGQMTDAFNDFIFTNPVGSKGIVKTEYGYHYIEILSAKGNSPAYKIAYFSRQILPSDQTVNTANGLASQFVADSRDFKTFEANAKKQNLNVFTAVDIKPLDENIIGVGISRELVRWIYKADKGAVAETPFMVGDKFIVPVVTQIYEKGTMGVDRARPLVEYRIRNDKKADQIIKKMGTPASLEAVAQAFNVQVQKADSLSFNGMGNPTLGMEQKVLGAAFNANNQNKITGPIKGEMGVYVIKVENLSAVSNPDFDVAQAKQSMEMQQEQFAAGGLIEAMKRAATVKDYRAEFY